MPNVTDLVANAALITKAIEIENNISYITDLVATTDVNV